jgi:hypothetical protein
MTPIRMDEGEGVVGDMFFGMKLKLITSIRLDTLCIVGEACLGLDEVNVWEDDFK